MENKKRTKILINIVRISILIVFTLGYMIFMCQSINKQYETRLKENGDGVAKNIQTQISDSLNYIEGMAQVFSNYEDIHSQEAIGTLERVGEKSHFSRIWLTKTSGSAISSDGQQSNASGRDYMTQALQGKSGISKVQISRLNGKKNIAIYAPIYYKGEVIGILMGIYEMDNLLNILDVQCFNGAGYCGIYDKSGELLVSSKEIEDNMQQTKYGYTVSIDMLEWNISISLPENIIKGEIRNYLIATVIMCIIWVSALVNFIVMGLQKKNQELKKRAQRDSLTNLLNRGTTENIINKQLKKNTKYENAFIILDIDKFKLVNDENGHLAGDIILKELAELMKNYFQEAFCLSRIGGDEFVIYIEEVSNREALMKKIEEFKIHIAKTYSKNKVKSTVSIGVTYSKNETDTFKKLYDEADQALYESKGNGGNTITAHGK